MMSPYVTLESGPPFKNSWIRPCIVSVLFLLMLNRRIDMEIL
jgi:hypothetical protein